MRIPLNKTCIGRSEIQYIEDAITRGVSGDGYYTKLVESILKEKFEAKNILMTTSATHALEMACILMEISEGDEVIMPSFSFPSTANAILLRGGVPVFVDICPETLNIDSNEIEKKITKKTKGIIPVHYGGVACKMNEIMGIAKRHGLKVLEDAAQAIGGMYEDRYLGTIGDFGCFSFHGTKNVTSGEGGALIINTNDEEVNERACQIRQKGTDYNAFLEEKVKEYVWREVGSSYAPSDVLMAMLYPQLNKLDEIIRKRSRVYDYYKNALEGLKTEKLIRVMDVPAGCSSNYHLFYLVLANVNIRDNLIKSLNQKGIGATFHFMPLHSSPMGKKLGYKKSDLPLTNKISEGLLRLPIYPNMTVGEKDFVITSFMEALKES